MSTIGFRIRGKNPLKSYQIKLRLSISRTEVFELSSGQLINADDWDFKKQFPKKNRDATVKAVELKLQSMLSNINISLVKAQNCGIEINRDWLQEQINNEYDDNLRINVLKPDTNEEKKTYLLYHIEKYIKQAPSKKIKGKSALGLEENTIKKYITFKNMMLRYEAVIKKKIKFEHLTKDFIDRFIHWLRIEQGYGENYAGKQIDHLKTMCNDAKKYDVKINSYSESIERFKENDNDRYIVTYTLDEIETIRNTEMPNERLENTKKWMLLGFEIGQRGSDLLKIDKSKITNIDEEGRVFWEFYQSKTRKWVNVPIINPHTINIVNNEFPYSISLQKLNDYMKEVLEICGFIEKTEGKKYISENGVKRKVMGIYPKWEISSSHTFRRSFATNWYQEMETSIVMEITGHTRENVFKIYINRRVDKEKHARNFAKHATIALERMQNEKANKSA